MRINVEVTVLRVFCGPDGSGGNPLGVVMEGQLVAADDRQAMAARLGYSETVFVDDPEVGRVRIFTPAVPLPFAGHPVVGTGWLLARRGFAAESLLTPAGRVRLRHEQGGRTWAAGRDEWCPTFELIELEGAEAVDAQEPGGEGWRYLWAWDDREAGTVRARCFAPEAGIAEDEASGAAALRLCASLGRPIEVRQGRGSIIHAQPIGDGLIEIGGAVAEGR